MVDPHPRWPGFSDSLTLIIDVDKSEFNIAAGPIDFDGKAFKPKRETHVTVFGSATTESVMERMRQNPESESALIQAFENTDWSYTITPDYRHLVRPACEYAFTGGTEESIIVLIAMNGMAWFYAELKRLALIDADLPVPPPHVTLYTYHCDVGIGIPSEAELAALTRRRIQKPA